MPQYPSNSDKVNEGPQPQTDYREHRVTEPVVSGNTKIKEKTFWDDVREFFGIAECNTFRDYVSALSDMTNRTYTAIDTLLGNRKYQNSTVPGARVSYQSYYNSPTTPPQQQVQGQQARTQQTVYSPSYIEFNTREDAELVLAKMWELLQIYQNVSVGDMFDLAGLTSPQGYTDFKYGWRDLSGARTDRWGSKFIILLPQAMPLR